MVPGDWLATFEGGFSEQSEKLLPGNPEILSHDRAVAVWSKGERDRLLAARPKAASVKAGARFEGKSLILQVGPGPKQFLPIG